MKTTDPLCGPKSRVWSFASPSNPDFGVVASSLDRIQKFGFVHRYRFDSYFIAWDPRSMTLTLKGTIRFWRKCWLPSASILQMETQLWQTTRYLDWHRYDQTYFHDFACTPVQSDLAATTLNFRQGSSTCQRRPTTISASTRSEVGKAESKCLGLNVNSQRCNNSYDVCYIT